MKQLLMASIIILGFSTTSYAQRNMDAPMEHHMTQKEIRKMDRVYTKYKAQRRNFRTKREYLHRSRHSMPHRYVNEDRYKQGYGYKRDKYMKHRRTNRQTGFAQSKRGWILAYTYDRASFYDDKGFYYGYFNQHGYFFEDVFYRFDRFYTYHDRVRGKGLFDHHYYMPANSHYYGFYKPLY